MGQRNTKSNARLRLEALLWVAAMRLGLSVLSFNQMRGLLERFAPLRRERRHDTAVLEHIGKAVEDTQRFVPRATCLPLALAAMALCRQQGLDAQLHLGIADTSGPQPVSAHAWVELEGTVVVGGEVTSQIPLGEVTFDRGPSPK